MNACQRVYLSSVMILVTFLWNATIDGSISLLPEVAAGRPCSQFSSANIESILRLISGDDTNVFAIDTCSHPKRRGVGEQKEKRGKVKKYLGVYIIFSLHFVPLRCPSSSSCNERSNGEGGKGERNDRSCCCFPLSSFSLFLLETASCAPLVGLRDGNIFADRALSPLSHF